jgi:Zn-dependent protease with chaperone function
MALVVAGLFISIVVLGCMAGPVLNTLRWPLEHPGMAAACWLAAVGGTMMGFAGAVAVVLLRSPAPGHGLLEWLHNCVPGHEHAGVAMAAVTGSVVTIVGAVRLQRGVPRLWRAIARRRRHRQMLDLIAREDGRHADVLVLDHPVPMAYCLPSPRRPIVISTGAQDHLNAEQLRAVLAHERAHLRQRHHIMLLLLDLVHALLPWLPTVRRASASVPLLLEMAADDVAARQCGGPALAGALRKLSITPVSVSGLAAGAADGRTLMCRLARLDSPMSRGSRGARLAAWGFFAGAIVAPLAAVAMAVMELYRPC